MYGIINKAAQDFITARFGVHQWLAIKQHAGIDLPAFVATDAYPDEVTYGMVAAASTLLMLPPPAIFEEFGEYWLEFCVKEGYGELLEMVGRDFVGFLKGLDNLHARLSITFSELRPPSILCTDITAGSVRVHYLSERQGLLPFVVGLVKGVGNRFALDLTISIEQDRSHGSDHDVLLIAFSSRGRS